MNSNTLAPRRAALFAQQAYLFKNPETLDQFLRRHKDSLEVNESKEGESISVSGKKLKGSTGALIFIKSSHVMGLCAFGIGEYEGQAFVFLKGTASLLDTLTDLNTGVGRSDTGGLVHQGFLYTFRSFLPQLQEFNTSIQKRGNIKAIHCVGHSLGGALATLTADWLKAKTQFNVQLYTFGSPRVGFQFFAENFTKKTLPENVFRVHHKHDPVAMIPTWPFMHVPYTGIDYLLSCKHINQHKMEFYVNSVSTNDKKSLDWATLRGSRPPEPMDQAIEQWLKSDTPISMTIETARVIESALGWVLKKVVQAGMTIVIGSVATVFTILDCLAILLHKAYDFTKNLGYWVMRLIIRMARAIGIIVSETANLSVSLIRSIFIRMHHNVSELVRKVSEDMD